MMNDEIGMMKEIDRRMSFLVHYSSFIIHH